MTFDEVMDHATDLLNEAETLARTATGPEDKEAQKARIYLTIAEWWLKTAETMQEQFAITERKREIDRNHELAEKLAVQQQSAYLNMGETTEPETQAYR